MSNALGFQGAHLIPVVDILGVKLRSQDYDIAAVIGSTLLTELQEWKSRNENENRMSDTLFESLFCLLMEIRSVEHELWFIQDIKNFLKTESSITGGNLN